MRKIILFCFCLIYLSVSAQYFLASGQDATECLGANLKDGKLTVTWKKTHPNFYPEGVQNTYTVWRDVYCSSNNAVVLEKTEVENYHPASTETHPERTEWPTNQ